MKKYINTILVLILVSGILAGCKKDKSPAAKDYASSIKDKTWWGVLTYTGKPAEYYSVHFSADNTLVWSQLSGDYTGIWTISNKTITLKFSGSGAEIKADLTEDDKLVAITDNTSSYEINNGQLISSPKISLENTIWKGTVIGGVSDALQLSFMAGSKVEIKLSNKNYGPFIYSRPASGGAFRADTGGGYYYFGVIVSANEMKGSANANDFPFQVNKQ